MPSEIASRVVILGTGGTIAGTAANPADHVGYVAGQRAAAELLGVLPGAAAVGVETEQVAQIDSKDMDRATWQRLAGRARHHLGRPEVAGVVVTHGTDTLEETAWLLHRVLAPLKPLVLTAAMRPATALSPDGPQNLADALVVARWPGAGGVVAVLAGAIHGAAELRKLHPYRVDAFASADAGPLGLVEAGQVRQFRPWPRGSVNLGLPKLGQAMAGASAQAWPWVEIVSSHADARPEGVHALVAAGVRGLVVACSGNGSVHAALLPALAQARASGVVVWRATRCLGGSIVADVDDDDDGIGPATPLSPWAARLELTLRLLCGAAA